MTPKKGGYMAHAPALDLTTLLEVIFLSLQHCTQTRLNIWSPMIRCLLRIHPCTCCPTGNTVYPHVIFRLLLTEACWGQCANCFSSAFYCFLRLLSFPSFDLIGIRVACPHPKKVKTLTKSWGLRTGQMSDTPGMEIEFSVFWGCAAQLLVTSQPH